MSHRESLGGRRKAKSLFVVPNLVRFRSSLKIQLILAFENKILNNICVERILKSKASFQSSLKHLTIIQVFSLIKSYN